MPAPPTPLGPHPSPSRLPHLLNLGLVLGLWIYAAVTYDDLPQRFATHFDAAGQADGWAAKSWGLWLLLPIVALFSTACFYAIYPAIRWARNNPALLSMPYKDELLALPDAQQAPVWRKTGDLGAILCVPTNAIFVYLQLAMGRAALGSDTGVTIWPIWVLLAAVVVLSIVLIWDLIRTVKRVVGRA